MLIRKLYFIHVNPSTNQPVNVHMYFCNNRSRKKALNDAIDQCDPNDQYDPNARKVSLLRAQASVLPLR